jgi:hypothetical protein
MGGQVMYKAALGLLVTFCSAIAFGQTAAPQWRVIRHVVLYQQTEPIPQTTLLTPTESGIYRVTVYLSGGGGTGTGRWLESLSGSDITGLPFSPGNLNVLCGELLVQGTPPVVVSLKPQVPLTYQVEGSGAPTCQYNLAITLEQLR